ncbi:FAD-binding oxidoreductase [Pseudomonas sp. SGAir0191]|uniref:NAD(P)/FAD-dependent oxidoreductase n=1 Tax=Pseudomonas sp. SGAir0191 TaxID=2217867 RepID=UPI000C2B98AC|nr:FAD-binding oxidoreductase [Pseudomonas sp. SGAir0191]AUA35353.1 FAD-binding oxidoreductase [Pseudomonas sp. SGAir0191]
MSYLFGEVDSYYADTAVNGERYPSLNGHVDVDVCVVGAGFSGLNTAIELAERGLTVVIVEAKTVGWAASGRNGGQLIRGFGADLSRFERILGVEGVAALYKLGLETVEIVQNRILKYQIDCDLTWGFCELAKTHAQFRGLAEEKAALERAGYQEHLELVPPSEMAKVTSSQCYVGGLIDPGSGHLHPLNLAKGEAAAAKRLGVRIFEHTAALDITYGSTVTVKTADGSVTAHTLVLAGNAHLGSLEPRISAKVLPAGSFIIATERLSQSEANSIVPFNRALCDQGVALNYFRLSADRRLLFGGSGPFTGTDPKDIEGFMRPKMLRVFPDLAAKRIDYKWGGMIGVGANRLPQIGRLRGHRNVYYAQAYSGHGLNMSHMAGRLIAEAITQQDDGRGFDLFAAVPHMSFPVVKYFRSPLLAVGMLWHRLKERLTE